MPYVYQGDLTLFPNLVSKIRVHLGKKRDLSVNRLRLKLNAKFIDDIDVGKLKSLKVKLKFLVAPIKCESWWF